MLGSRHFLLALEHQPGRLTNTQGTWVEKRFGFRSGFMRFRGIGITPAVREN
jgi:hypothetical protein